MFTLKQKIQRFAPHFQDFSKKADLQARSAPPSGTLSAVFQLIKHNIMTKTVLSAMGYFKQSKLTYIAKKNSLLGWQKLLTTNL